MRLPALEISALTETESARFMEKVRQHAGGCWEWIAAKNSAGYGMVTIRGLTYRAHRVALRMAGLAVPKDMLIDHVCRNRACVNPKHLRLVDNKTNLLEPRSLSPARINSQKTHCSNGHPLEGDNVIALKRGGRKCRECHRAHCRKQYANRRAGIPPLRPGRPTGGAAA